MLALFINQ